jgi:hypothetical protein
VFTFVHEHSSTRAKVIAVLVFLAWPVGFCVHLYRLISVKVVREKRAALVKDKHGAMYWKDAPPCWGGRNRWLARLQKYFCTSRALWFCFC